MKKFIISKIDANQRIDKFIKRNYKNAPLSIIYKTFRKKDIKVNGHRVKENYIIIENDIVEVYIDDKKLEEFQTNEEFKIVDYPLDIVYEDKNILIINKDNGVLIHGDSHEKKYTLSNFVISYLINKGEYNPKIDTFVPSPIHRLDRNTSGLVIFAKNLISSKEGMELFKNKVDIEKHYRALVFGKINEHGYINAPLLKNSNTNTVKVDFEKGKDALSEYTRISYNDKYSFIDVNLITGRTHQIRVHLSYIKYPVVGDEKYGNFVLNKEFNKEFKYEKQFLHAYSLTFKNIKGNLSYLSDKTFVAKLKKNEENILKILKLI